jgi:hypothetical protein
MGPSTQWNHQQCEFEAAKNKADISYRYSNWARSIILLGDGDIPGTLS